MNILQTKPFSFQRIITSMEEYRIVWADTNCQDLPDAEEGTEGTNSSNDLPALDLNWLCRLKGDGETGSPVAGLERRRLQSSNFDTHR